MLVEDPESWPGLTTIPELVHGIMRLFPWYDGTKRYRDRQRGVIKPDGAYRVDLPLRLEPLPCFAHLPIEEQRKRHKELLCEAKRRCREQRGDKPVLGVQGVLAQHPHDKPNKTKRSPRPLCLASSRAARQAYREAYGRLTELYAEASRRFRNGEAGVEFPEHTFPPPLPMGWRPQRAPPPAVAG